MQMSAPYGWIIVSDLLDDRTVAIIGPRNISPAIEAQLRNGAGETFRLKDDDGEPYFLGRFIGDSTSEHAFGPLDDYGMPDSGCTSIEYHRGGRWEVL
jgi:hypothetical protein